MSGSRLKPLFIVCVMLAAIWQANVNALQRAATIQHISVTGDDQAVEIEIAANLPITARTQVLTDPDRLIIDVPEALPASGLHKMLVNRGELRDIRTGLLSANPRITRIVLDLTSATQYRVSPSGNKVLVELGASVGVAKLASENERSTEPEPAGTKPAVVTPAPDEAPPSRLRWILPIFFTAIILAMLVISLIVHIQNKRARRGSE